MSVAANPRLAELERAAQQAREAAERAGEPWPPYVPMPVGPKPPEVREPVVDKIAGTVLANVELQPRDAARLCSPLGLVFGFTLKAPHGAVADGWSWRIRWGLGRRNHDGALIESVALRFEHSTPSRGFLLWVWTRTPANVPLLLALSGLLAPQWWLTGPGTVLAMLRLMPSTKWTASPVLEWKATGPGRITQPEPIASTEAKKIIRIGGWA